MTSSANGINLVARDGFDKAASAYDENRPDYPEGVLSFLRNLKPETIVDIGAGTGIFTRLLLLSGATRTICVEPLEKMRAQLPATVEILADLASNMNIPDNTADIVACGQSFHWFATKEALNEIHRILKPGGSLVLVWNTPDHGKGHVWHDECTEFIDSFAPADTCRYKWMKWKSVFEDEPKQQLFTMPLCLKRFDNVKKMTPEKFIDYTLTGSFLAILPKDSQIAVGNRLREIIISHMDNYNEGAELDMPFVTDLYWCTARKE